MQKILNPITWLRALIEAITLMIRGILAGFGIGQLPVVPSQHGSKASDVDDVARLAAGQEAAVDALQRQRTPGDVVHAYAIAESEVRSTIDLSTLDDRQQDWLMRLTDADLVMLAGSGPHACARSVEKLKVMPSYRKLRVRETETAPRVLALPSQEDMEAARGRDFREQYEMLRRSLTDTQMKPVLA